MNLQPNHKALQLLPKTHSSEKLITISVSANALQKLLPFLLDQNIPFSLSAFGMKPQETQSIETMTSGAAILPSSKPIEYSAETKAEAIYQKYINEGKIENPPRIEEIAAEFGMKTIKLKSIFMKHYGKSFYQLYKEKRMEYAAKLLSQGMRATKVSQCMGYAHPIKFNKMFQKHFGKTPKRYQMEIIH